MRNGKVKDRRDLLKRSVEYKIQFTEDGKAVSYMTAADWKALRRAFRITHTQYKAISDRTLNDDALALGLRPKQK